MLILLFKDGAKALLELLHKNLNPTHEINRLFSRLLNALE